MRFKVGSLFAGVGGVCQGFKDASANVIWANEFDKNARITYKKNHPETKLHICDVKDITHEMLSDIDILAAGFPCQPFSCAGHCKGFEDERGTLFFDVIRLLKELKPKAYFIENVKRLTTHDNGNTFKVIKNELLNAGYSFIPFVLNAAEHTDIPQGRERIYIVGFRNESNYFFDSPVAENINNQNSECFYSTRFSIPKKIMFKHSGVRAFLDHKTVKHNDYYSSEENRIHKVVRDAVVNKDSVYQYRRYYIRENKSSVCPTLTANMGTGGHNVPIILDKYMNKNTPRRLTPKECFNLQGFPADFKLPKDVARGQLYKQAGNSVVVPMVKLIADEMVRVLNGNNRS